MTADDDRPNDIVYVLVRLDAGEVVIVVCDEGAQVHIIPDCVVCNPGHDEITCFGSFEREARQTDGKVSYLWFW